MEINGAKVRTASSGAEALEALSQHEFDVIISDVSMPEMDGFEFLRQLRKRPQCQDLPVLALTGFGRPEDIERAKTAGFFSHITKPFDLEKLAATLQTLPNRKPKAIELPIGDFVSARSVTNKCPNRQLSSTVPDAAFLTLLKRGCYPTRSFSTLSHLIL